MVNHIWLVVDLPLWKIMEWVRQLGSWHSQLFMESHKIPWFQTTNQTKCIPMFHGSKPFLCHLAKHAAVVFIYFSSLRENPWGWNPHTGPWMVRLFGRQPPILLYNEHWNIHQPTKVSNQVPGGSAHWAGHNLTYNWTKGGPPSTKYHHYWIPKSTVISVTSPYNIPISNIPSYSQAVISYILYEIPGKTIS